MAARKKKTTKKKTTARTLRGRLDAELPPSLSDFVRQMTTQLNRLEKQLEKAEGRYRRD